MTQIVEVAEDGTITVPRQALPESRPGARYRLLASEGDVRLLPVEADQSAPTSDAAEWEAWDAEWKAISDDLTAAWPEGVSAEDAISEMRR